MKLHTFFCTTLLTSTLYALGLSSPLVVHERRHNRYGLKRGARAEYDSIIQFGIALKQSNLDNGYDYILNISDPSSPHYGKLWKADDVRQTFAPTTESFKVVRAWLSSAGIEDVDERKGWLYFNTTAGHAENLMQSELYEHDEHETGAIRVGCDRYHLPEHVSKHVDFVTPGVALSAPLEKRTVIRRGNHPHGHWRHGHPCPPWPNWPHNPWRHHKPDHPLPGSKGLPPDLRNCGEKMTPTCLRALYSLPSPEEIAKFYDSNPQNAVGVFEETSVYRQSDLDKFFHKYAPNVPPGTHPTLDSIEDADLFLPRNLSVLSLEANIDLDIIYSLTYPQEAILYQGLPTYGSEKVARGYGLSTAIDELLQAIDGSFCTEKDRAKGQDCGTYSPTRVISVSYGSSEVLYSEAQQHRQCNEFMKLGLQGVTFTVSSGDYGVADTPSYIYDTNGCIVPDNYTATTIDAGPSLNGSVFNPIYPQNCPYVLSVGGTQLNSDDTVRDAERVMFVPELTRLNLSFVPNPPATFSSSGGFSNYFSRPDYQKSAVNSYFKNYDPGYPYYNFNGVDFAKGGTNIGENGGKYNRLGRGSPDVSANGVNLMYHNVGVLQPGFGTSLSAPVWASIFTLINEQRTKRGKSPVGFVNPVLYAHPEVFNDITNGKNPGCFTDGFSAVEGWDPTTGLGTPNYPKLLELFLSLP